MIVETQTRNIQRSSSFQERAMGLAKGSESFVFNVLRKDLYSDPIGSLIREYTVNAQDEHRKYGKSDKPIFIQAPNQFSPELHIRDYAEGLTEEQVFHFFGNYGASDKRQSNDSVGFFGLGCKSAFAYTDSFVIKSFKNGIVRTFNAYIDETEIGKVAKISEESTNEPNGVLIIVPVKTYDINTFQQKVISTVKYFKVGPIIKGMEVPAYGTETSLIKGNGWKFFDGRGLSKVIMGEIAYPIPVSGMGEIENWESHILNSNVNIYVNIGDVQVTASREALQMTPKTIAIIREKLANIRNTVVAEIEKSIAKAKNIIEAKTIWHTILSSGNRLTYIIKNQDIKWKGETIKNDYIHLNENHRVISYSYNHRKTRIKTLVTNNIFCDGTPIYFDDTDKSTNGYKNRARTLLNNDEEVIVIQTDDKKDLESILGLSVKELKSFNAVPKTVITYNRSGAGIDNSKRAKHTSKVFVLNVDKLLRQDYSASSEIWDVKEVEDVKGVYLSIDRFKPIDVGRIYSLSVLAHVLTSAKSAGIDIDVPIYGIKKNGDVSGLVKFEEWINAKVAANKKLIKEYSFAMAYENQSLINVSMLDVEKLPDDSFAKKYATLYDSLKNFGYTGQSKFKIFKLLKVEVDEDKTVATLSKEFEQKYPMLKFVDPCKYSKPEILEYIAEREGGINSPKVLTNSHSLLQS